MTGLQQFLVESAEVELLPWARQLEAMERFGVSCADVEGASLKAGILPARYQRNLQMISKTQQLQLFRSKVAVIGAGGLGGYILEQLARLGVGQIVTIDDDVFEENNLNRQLFSSPANLGRVKVEVAAERLAEINPAVTVQPIRARFENATGADLLCGADCVVDAVDNVPARLALAEVCRELQVPLVHGAIAGWYGHVATVLPGDDTLQAIYQHWTGGKGVEATLGNPSFTPAVAASLEVAEVCKILLKQGNLLRNRKLAFDLLDMEMHEISLK